MTLGTVDNKQREKTAVNHGNSIAQELHGAEIANSILSVFVFRKA